MGYVVDPSVGPPPPVIDVTSSDGRLRAIVHAAFAGVWLRCTFSSLSPDPYKIKFMRDGVPVRSGYFRRSPGGVAKAYDMLAPLGVSHDWSAEGYSQDGVKLYSTTTASLTVPEPTRAQGDVWLKSVNDPALSMLCLKMEPGETVSAEGRSSMSASPTSSLAMGTWAPAVRSARSVIIKTRTKDEHDRLWKLLGSGMLYVQEPAKMYSDDFWAFPGKIDVSPQDRQMTPTRLFTIELLPTTEPSHLDAPLIVPGRSWGDFKGTWAAAAATFPTWGAATKP